ncbi:SAV_2336 N-terminal domain-related protein, partial [Streptomyces viridiviolaceus]
MAEDTAGRLVRLASPGSGDIDVEQVLDAVLLAATWVRANRGHNSSRVGTEDTGQPERTPQEGASPKEATQTAGAVDTAGTAHPTASVWLEDPTSNHRIPGKQATIGRATALPDALGIGRALRPLRRPWPSGAHRRLDVDATVEHYTRTGMLIPRLAPAPEPWLEVIVVLDRGTAMAVWDEAVRVFTQTLRALAAFRAVRLWHLEHPPDEPPVLRDHHGRTIPVSADTSHVTQPARRLLLVVSDCAAPAWRQAALWQTLHAWGRTAPVALINPLPRRLWQRSGLDLPRATATAPVPAAPGRLLSFRPPRLLRETPETKPWQALPVLQLEPDQILTWARTLMRTDPSGCGAVLVPATGRSPLRPRPGMAAQPETRSTDDQVRAQAEAFTDDREAPAVRLAIAAVPLGSFTLPVLDVLRQRLVPEAGLADTAEFLTAGLLTATRCGEADITYHFHPAAAAHLTKLCTRHQLWDAHFALTDHLAASVRAPHGIPVVLHSPFSTESLPTGARPIARAAAATARLLGVEPTEPWPDADRSVAGRPSADTGMGQAEGRGPASGQPDASSPRADLAASSKQPRGTSEAVEAEEQESAGAEQTLAAEGLDTLTARVALATSHWDEGRTSEAIAVLEEVVAESERLLGAESTGTLTARASLAGSYSLVGRMSEAVALLEQVAADRERIQGADHADTLTARARLATSYRD